MRQVAIWIALYYLRFWAHRALQIHRPQVIGITGSVGKSSARNAVYALLRHKGHIKVIEKGNSETGVPLGILGLAPRDYSTLDWLLLFIKAPFHIYNLKNTAYLVVEMGIDEPDPPKNMGYLLTIIKPDIAVFLNVHPVHTMQFDKTVPPELTGNERLEKILHNIAAEKGRIITESGCKIAIYNADNTYVSEVIDTLAPSAPSGMQLLRFGSDTRADIAYKNYEVSLSGTTFSFVMHKKTINISLKKYLLPEEYKEEIAAAFLVGKSLAMSSEEMIEALETNFTLPAGRSSMFTGINSSIIIDSSYNASKAAVLAFLHLIKKIRSDRKVVFVFGDMRELGRESEIEHKAVAAELEKIIDYLYCVGPQTKQYVVPNVKVKEVKWFKTSAEAGEYLKDHLPDNAIVLVKGSQNTIFLEEAIKPLLAHKEDMGKLCRQSDYWMKIKKSQS